MTELKIIAVITAKEEYKNDIVKALHAVVDGTRKEEGNISYDLHQDMKNPLRYIFIEVWKSQEAINSHNQSAHFQQFVKAIEGKIEGLDIDFVKQVY
ncbi:putative quinol monooxygenase [Dysgonomonas sp. 25]|uniref:putative quinol monooxygenase n=1 Tax=Dysgonomonas sp. 25 TaxID=2302933 RepID=UPI0013D39C41|nr:putative quinol monooxygenase [Dysgonomonas sp. 25]NDV68264.1 antibiotic biosynthesis monooxygenase [Dysgonomonas sp. 25]